MFKEILNSQTRTIGAAALIVAFANLASRLLGIWRDRVLAGTFGAGDELDIYYAAFRIPDLIFHLLVVGGLSASFIPIFLEYRQRSEESKKDEHWRMASNILNLTVMAVFLCALAAFFFMPWIFKIVTPGFAGEKLDLAVNMSRLILVSPLFLAISNVFGGVLQGFRRFLVFSFSAIFYNLGIIFGALVLVDFWGIYGLAWGVIFGAFLHAAVQAPTLWGCGFRYSGIFDFRHPAVSQIVKLMIPRTLSLGILQFNWIIMTALASTLAAGSLAIFNLANNFQGFIVGLFGVSFATAAFPVLSEAAAKKDFSEFSKTFFSTLRQISFFAFPASVLLIVLAAPLVIVVLETGSFQRAAALETAGALRLFSLSIFTQAAALLMVRAFFAFKNTLFPFLAALATVAVNVILALVFLGPFGVKGLALAYSAASFLNFAALCLFFRKITPLKFFGDFPRLAFLKIIFASAVAGLAAWLVFCASGRLSDSGIPGSSFLQLVFPGICGLFVYAFFALALKSEEMFNFWRVLKNFFRKKPPIPSAISLNGQ